MKTNITLLFVVLALAAVAAFFFVKNRSGTLQHELSDFAVEDTAAIDKIFMADKFGSQVTLTREVPGRWMVNGEARARNEMVNMLLTTIRQVEVRSPVAKAAFNNVMKKMAATSTKVEIYAAGKVLKTYYVGHETQDQYGTFMYLENSSVPFVIHIPGFDGFLTSRYSSVPHDWIPNTVFDHSVEEIEELVVENMQEPAWSFAIRANDNQSFALFSYPGGQLMENAVHDKMVNFLGYFSGLNYEFTAKDLPGEKIDSIRNTSPFLRITIKGKRGIRKAAFYRKPELRSREALLDVGIVQNMPFDTDRFYLQIDDDPAMHAAQYYVFGKLFIKPSALLEEPVP